MAEIKGFQEWVPVTPIPNVKRMLAITQDLGMQSETFSRNNGVKHVHNWILRTLITPHGSVRSLCMAYTHITYGTISQRKYHCILNRSACFAMCFTYHSKPLVPLLVPHNVTRN